MNNRLSILIPAYGYAGGVKTILSNFRDDALIGLEILISDDSSDDLVERVVSEQSPHFRGKLRYRRNQPRLGAVANWNSLLEWASGEYVLLLHHDEYPLGLEFTRRVLELLESAPEVDVFVLECVLSSMDGKDLRHHMPGLIQKLVLKYFPTYLFRRNVVGPTSCLIVRRDLYPRFDERLHWLVDVDAYFRLRKKTARWRVCRHLKIGSTLGRKDSITASIKDKLKDLDQQERIYLNQKHPEARVWLASRSYRISNALEHMAWVSMRVITRLYCKATYSLRTSPNIVSHFQRKSNNDRM